VRAFLYNLDSKDSLPILQSGQLDQSVADTKGVILTDAQVSRLLAAVTGNHSDHGVAGCYIPHHAYVFYNKRQRIVGWVELCFGCMNYHASSPNAPRVFDVSSLLDLTKELGLPVLNKDTDYSTLKVKSGSPAVERR